MGSAVVAVNLLKRAAELLDSRNSPLTISSTEAIRIDFTHGAVWMSRAIQVLRKQAIVLPSQEIAWNRIGLLKYGLCFLVGFFLSAIAVTLGISLLFLPILFLLGFYLTEAQMVFLFPLILDGSSDSLRASRDFTRRAGGTLVVMANVLILALTMIFGGFVGRGFVRSWCLGCLGVVLWYEELRVWQTEEILRLKAECGAEKA